MICIENHVLSYDHIAYKTENQMNKNVGFLKYESDIK